MALCMMWFCKVNDIPNGDIRVKVFRVTVTNNISILYRFLYTGSSYSGLQRTVILNIVSPAVSPFNWEFFS